jgi:stearoyl-CoA desaturase (delta-9 desaturase)
LSRASFRTRLELVPDFARYPELRLLDRYDTLVPALLAAGLFAWGGPDYLVWGFCVSTVALWHATFTINSLAHRFGRRRYATRDDSRNNLWLALLTFGEGWHNNHHHYPGAARQGFYWWEVDLTWYGLKLLAALGVVRELKPVPAGVREARWA